MKKSILLFTLLTGWFNSYTQILAGHELWAYTDINPDTLIDYYCVQSEPPSTENYYFDINGDIQNDFQVTAHCSLPLGIQSLSINITSLNPSAFIRFGRVDSVHTTNQGWMVAKVAKPLYFGDTINSSAAQWDSLSLFLTKSTATFGSTQVITDWVDTIDEYIGIKYQTSSDTTYGWIRVYCPARSQCYIKDYSFGMETPACADTTYIPTILTSENLVLCGVDTVWLVAENGYDQYLWSNGETTRDIEATSAGDYFVDALIDTCWFRSDTIHVDAATPVADFSVSFNGFVASFTNLSTDATSWSWNFGDPNETIVDSSTQENPVWTYTEVYDFPITACLFAYYDMYCYDIYCEQIISGSISSVNTLSLLNLYPNPATTHITIDFQSAAGNKQREIEIYNTMGQLVFSPIAIGAATNPNPDSYRDAIDVSGFSKGLYLFKVRAGEELLVKKVVVE